ncbi:MAG TPA: thioredoxin family protein [Candidatus Acidoferrum sp.]|nr:thioredoxin family protein [Candidatus Acidoferrum sp.]
MNLSNNWTKSSALRIPLFAALVYAYFCAPVSLEHKAFVQPITASAPHTALADGYDPRRDPDKDLSAASEEAKRSNKNIFVVVGGEWCSWCHTLDRFFHEHADIESLRDKYYVVMKVSMSQENPNRAFLSRFPRIHGYPYIFILDAQGKLIQSQPTNELEDGRSYNAERFRKLLEHFAPRA